MQDDGIGSRGDRNAEAAIAEQGAGEEIDGGAIVGDGVGASDGDWIEREFRLRLSRHSGLSIRDKALVGNQHEPDFAGGNEDGIALQIR